MSLTMAGSGIVVREESKCSEVGETGNGGNRKGD